MEGRRGRGSAPGAPPRRCARVTGRACRRRGRRPSCGRCPRARRTTGPSRRRRRTRGSVAAAGARRLGARPRSPRPRRRARPRPLRCRRRPAPGDGTRWPRPPRGFSSPITSAIRVRRGRDLLAGADEEAQGRARAGVLDPREDARGDLAHRDGGEVLSLAAAAGPTARGPRRARELDRVEVTVAAARVLGEGERRCREHPGAAPGADGADQPAAQRGPGDEQAAGQDLVELEAPRGPRRGRSGLPGAPSSDGRRRALRRPGAAPDRRPSRAPGRRRGATRTARASSSRPPGSGASGPRR